MVDATLRGKWPDHLVSAIASHNFVCFVGSGVSASCTNASGDSPPAWADLITGLASQILTTAAHSTAVRKLVNREDFLGAAELLKYYAAQSGKQQDLYSKLASQVESGPDVYEPSAWHNELLRLDPLTIVTTNYDRILERATKSGFSMHGPDSTKIDADIRTGTPVLIKVHGSVDRREDMVLCQSDYVQLRQTSSHLLDILEALFLTRTCLFIGYSFQDPDIQLVLGNVAGARGVLPSHYILTEKGGAPHRKHLFEKAYGVTPIEYKAGDHAGGLELLRALAELVEERRASFASP